MFQGIKKLFGGKKEEGQILAPVAGQAVPLSEVPDPAFAQEILGKGGSAIYCIHFPSPPVLTHGCIFSSISIQNVCMPSRLHPGQYHLSHNRPYLSASGLNFP